MVNNFKTINIAILSPVVENEHNGSFKLNWEKKHNKGSVTFVLDTNGIKITALGDSIDILELLHAFYDNYTARRDLPEECGIINGEFYRDERAEAENNYTEEHEINVLNAEVWGPHQLNDGGIRFTWSSDDRFGEIDFFLKDNIVFVDGEFLSHNFIRKILTTFANNQDVQQL